MSSNHTTNARIIRYLVSIPGQAQPASYNVGLGMKTAQLYADLTAKAHRGAIYAVDSNGDEELVGSYVRKYRSDSPAAESTTA